MARLRKINEARDVKVGPANFSFYVDTDPLRARFMAKTSADLDQLDDGDQVQQVIDEMGTMLGKVTGFKWIYDSGDPGAGYSFTLDEQSVAAKIEESLSKASA